jgi:hypothetical protein
LLAAVMSQPDTSAEEAYRVATSQPMREVLAVLDERSWGMMSPEEKDDAKFKQWARAEVDSAARRVDLGGWAA